jgi:peptidoglycan-associated lipoprotein
MKPTTFANVLIIGLVLTLASTGCRKKPAGVTPLPGAKTSAPEMPGAGGPLVSDTRPIGNAAGVDSSAATGIPPNAADSHKGWIENAEIFKSDTVYFEFDSSVVKASEKPKVAHIVEYLKANPANAVRVEGNCDERGTEEYNHSLGERRALAVREELVKEGVDPLRADTISYGKDKPADPGHDEGAWRKNRRDDFILLSPPK